MGEVAEMDSKAIDSFFSRIVGMIPLSLYRHTLSEEQNAADEMKEGNSKYFKHRKLPLTADERKVLSKKKMIEKYSCEEEMEEDGSNAHNENNHNEEEEQEEDKEDDEDDAQEKNSSSSSTSEGIDGLRQRLQARILGLKNDRVSKKQTAPKPTSQPKKADGKQKSAAKESPIVPEVPKETTTPRVVEKEGNDLDTLQFNNLLDTQKKGKGSSSSSAKLQSGNKVQRLKRLLDETEKKRERLKELSQQARAKSGDKRGSSSSSSGSGGEEALHAAKKLKVEMWNDALKTASGDKSHVAGSKESEQRLKKALKRIEKKKQKSTNEWADRLESAKEEKDARIKKKEDNLSARKDKKDFYPVAPEGAGAPRPGFEGKKQELLNKAAKKS